MREDPVTTPATDFPKAQRVHEAHKVVEAHVRDVSAPNPNPRSSPPRSCGQTPDCRA